ncbi:MAG: site-specific integrase [Pirellula sp.]
MVADEADGQGPRILQVILSLSRYGGLRTPSETLSLRWEDIDWEMNRMSIPEPKVEHHEGRGIRSCPIFPELRPILDEAFEIFGDKSEYAVAAPQYQAAAQGSRQTPLCRSLGLNRRTKIPGGRHTGVGRLQIEPDGTQNRSVSFRCTSSALGLAIRLGSHSRVTC